MKGRVTLARTALRSLPFELSAVRLLHLVCHGVELRGEVLDKVSEFLPRLHLLAGTSVPFRSFNRARTSYENRKPQLRYNNTWYPQSDQTLMARESIISQLTSSGDFTRNCVLLESAYGWMSLCLRGGEPSHESLHFHDSLQIGNLRGAAPDTQGRRPIARADIRARISVTDLRASRCQGGAHLHKEVSPPGVNTAHSHIQYACVHRHARARPCPHSHLSEQ